MKKPTWIYWLSIPVLLILAGAGFIGWTIFSKGSGLRFLGNHPPLALPSPVVSAGFPDGAKLEVLQTGVSRIEDGIYARSSGMGSWSSSTHSFGSGTVNRTLSKSNKQLVGLKFEATGPFLLLETRFVLSSGQAAVLARGFHEGAIRGLTDGRGKKSPFPGSTAMRAPGADPDDFPDVLVQLSDGNGGWITGEGPLPQDEDPEARSVIWFKSWPRALPVLEFRALRPGMEPVTFRIPNPSPPRPDPGWKADPLPVRFDHRDFTLTLKKLWQQDRLEQWPLTGASLEFTSKLDKPGKPPETLRYDLVGMEDAEGNLAPKEIFELEDGSSVSGCALPPRKGPFRVHARVTRTDSYPLPITACTILTEGRVAADGMSLELSPPTWRLGVKSITADRVSPTGFHLKIMGEFDTAKLPEIEAPHGKISEWQLAVFLDEDPESSGRTSSGGSGMNQSGGSGSFGYEATWNGALKPGQRVRIGVTSDPKPTDVFFTVEREWLK